MPPVRPEIVTHINILMGGCALMASLAISFIFLRFWQKTKDRFFALLSVSFALLALERLLLTFNSVLSGEHVPFIYILRLITFFIIIYGVIDKNRADTSK